MNARASLLAEEAVERGRTGASLSQHTKKYLVALGKKGGQAGTGKAKARTPEQARKAAEARWGKKKPKV